MPYYDFNYNFSYDHYDYAKGIDDLTTLIRSKTGLTDIIVFVDWFYAKDMDQSLLEANLQHLTDLHFNAGSPLQFKT